VLDRRVGRRLVLVEESLEVFCSGQLGGSRTGGKGEGHGLAYRNRTRAALAGAPSLCGSWATPVSQASPPS
jgi:hypothetical protein